MDESSNENNDGTVEGWSVEFHVDPIPEPGVSALVAVFFLAVGLGRRRIHGHFPNAS